MPIWNKHNQAVRHAYEDEQVRLKLEAIKEREATEAENRRLRNELERRLRPEGTPTRDDLIELARTNPAEFNRRIDAGEVTDQFGPPKEFTPTTKGTK